MTDKRKAAKIRSVVTQDEIRAVMAALGKRGGKARAQALTEARRSEIAAAGGRAGKGKTRPRPSLGKKK